MLFWSLLVGRSKVSIFNNVPPFPSQVGPSGLLHHEGSSGFSSRKIIRVRIWAGTGNPVWGWWKTTRADWNPFHPDLIRSSTSWPPTPWAPRGWLTTMRSVIYELDTAWNRRFSGSRFAGQGSQRKTSFTADLDPDGWLVPSRRTPINLKKLRQWERGGWLDRDYLSVREKRRLPWSVGSKLDREQKSL